MAIQVMGGLVSSMYVSLLPLNSSCGVMEALPGPSQAHQVGHHLHLQATVRATATLYKQTINGMATTVMVAKLMDSGVRRINRVLLIVSI